MEHRADLELPPGVATRQATLPALLRHRARTAPPVGGAELAALLRKCHVYVTASQHEPGGMHFIEGLQCGLPLIFHEDGGGIPERYVVQRHVLRNALVPITTAAGLTIAGLIAGTVVVENAFALNGLGSFLVQAVGQKDVPVVQAICLILVAAFIVVNTVVDLLYAVIDPRIGFGGGRDR